MAEHKRIPQHALSLEAREGLCRELLAEFGVTRVSVFRGRQEINFRCCLPWHRGKDMSASLNYEKLTFRCLSAKCDSSGGLLWFIATCREISGAQAREWVDGETGISVDGYTLSALLGALEGIWTAPGGPPGPPMPRMSPRLLDSWDYVHPYLTDPLVLPEDWHDPILERPRGIPVENLRAMRVGWNPERDRVTVPHFWRGDLVGWQSRRTNRVPRADLPGGEPREPLRWQSSADFPRETTIYNYDPSREWALVVESPMSVVRHCHHLPMEATFGAAITDAQVRHLAAHRRVVVWPDNDDGGWRAMEGKPAYRREPRVPGLGERLADYSDVRVVWSPLREDPADLGDDVVEALVADALPYSTWRRPASLMGVRELVA